MSGSIDPCASEFSVVCPVGKTGESMEKGAWQRKERGARRAGAGVGIRGLAGEGTREMARGLHGLHISGSVR